MERIWQKGHETRAVRGGGHRDLIDRIAVGLAHEIRNPLTVIKGYMQLQEKRSACYAGEPWPTIYQEIRRIEELISNMVLLAQNKTSKKTPANLNRILNRLYPAIEQAAEGQGITAELLLDSSLPMLELNTPEIEQLIRHLADNGIEAMQAKGRLTIGTARQDGQAILFVQDKGSGIAGEDLERIFEPFYTTKAGNTGLGLAISLSIVERHYGQIEIVSTMGEGSLFKVLFPVPEQKSVSGSSSALM